MPLSTVTGTDIKACLPVLTPLRGCAAVLRTTYARHLFLFHPHDLPYYRLKMSICNEKLIAYKYTNNDP